MNNKTSEEKWVIMTELNGEALLHHFKFSSYGRVVRIKKGVGIEEEFIPKTINGYQFMSFTTLEKSRITIYLHRLIAEFYVNQPTIDNADFVIHVDGDRLNNRADNLKWITDEEMRERRASNRRGKGKSKATATNKIVKKAAVSSPSELQVAEVALKRKHLAEYFGISQ